MDQPGSAVSSLTPASDVNSYFLDTDLVLFSERTQRLYHLNTTAAFIWCCCEDRLTPEAIVQAVADTFDISKNSVHQDVLQVIAEWKALGLLAEGQYQNIASPPSFEDKDTQTAATDFLDPAALPILYTHEHRYRLIDTQFRVRFSDANAERLVHPVLAHLETPANAPFHLTVDVIKDEAGYVLLQETIPITRCATLAELAPLVHGHVLLTAYPAANCLLAVHAAAISRKNQCILLPGTSGSGKSTLAAALMSCNFIHFTDELALLTRDTHHLRPVPVCLSLKEGSWSVLAPFHPIIKDLPVHVRHDSKVVRYLPPIPIDHANILEQGHPVKCIVFPVYKAQNSTTISALSQAEALCRLTEAGYDVNGRLDAARVGELVNWIADLDCYELKFSCLSEAISLIEELLP